jgi:diguanylate cyclase (GGDEF)-like protein
MVPWITATVAPLVIAPLMSSYLIGLLVEINLLEIEMRTLATYDTLTGVHNRGSFMAGAELLSRLASRHKQAMSIVMLDIDSFKRVNDALGHAAGDAVLKSLGELLRNHARSGDLIGRIGGEEFSILLPETSLEVAINVADRLHELVRAAAIEFDGNTLRYTVSMGIAAVDAGEETNREIAYLLRLADAGLYAAKQEGRNRTRMVPTSALSDVGLASEEVRRGRSAAP